MKTIVDKKLVQDLVKVLGESGVASFKVDVRQNKITVNTEDIESRIYILEQYLATLDKTTPHYRDKKKYLERLKKHNELI